MAEAASVMEDDLARICEEITRISGGGDEVSFGALARDDGVSQRFEALLGTLKAARKRGLIAFDGELLLMGQHDNVPIRIVGAPAAAASIAAAEEAAADTEPRSAAEDIAATANLASHEDLSAKAAAAEAEASPQQPEAEEVRPAQAEAEATSLAPAAVDTAELAPASPEAVAAAVDESAEGRSTGSAGRTEEEEGKSGKWSVDMSYIDHRTADPDRLEGRRVGGDTGGNDSAAGGAVAANNSQTRDKDGKWTQVDVSYINHRTAQVENLEGRKGAPLSADGKETASATVKKESDGKWKVDTSYINHRTAEVENLEGKQSVGSGTIDSSTINAVASSTTKKESDGKWKVDTSYVNHRTAMPENLEARKQTDTAASTSAPAANFTTTKKDTDGSWKVDTSYIGFRTGDTANLTRNEEKLEADDYADPASKKYPYEELKGMGNRPSDVDPKCKEQYLSAEEFQDVFQMSLADFQKLPKWKQQNLKKAKDVF